MYIPYERKLNEVIKTELKHTICEEKKVLKTLINMK